MKSQVNILNFGIELDYQLNLNIFNEKLIVNRFVNFLFWAFFTLKIFTLKSS